MKLRIYFNPVLIVLGLALAALMFWIGTGLFDSWLRWPCLTFAVFYSVLGLISAYALWRCRIIEHWMSWDHPQRLLILAPHQDDCVICAGGIGVRNQKLGGETHVLYLVQDAKPGMAERRRAEAIASWALAGLPAAQLQHLDLLPPLRERNPQRLQGAAAALQQVVDSIAPTVLILPLFEGGHIHHDVLNHLVTQVLRLPPGLKVFECPEYSPYCSLRWTPHRVIALCSRWLGGGVAYYGPPDGIDARPVLRVHLTADELVLKRRMLASFESQHGDSLARTRAYPDRLIKWQTRHYRARPFKVAGSYVAFVMLLQRWLPARLVQQILPGQLFTHGRDPGLTNLDDEL